MQETNNILDLKVSFQENTWTNVSIEPTIKNVLDAIQSDRYKQQVTDLRTSLDNGNNNPPPNTNPGGSVPGSQPTGGFVGGIALAPL